MLVSRVSYELEQSPHTACLFISEKFGDLRASLPLLAFPIVHPGAISHPGEWRTQLPIWCKWKRFSWHSDPHAYPLMSTCVPPLDRCCCHKVIHFIPISSVVLMLWLMGVCAGVVTKYIYSVCSDWDCVGSNEWLLPNNTGGFLNSWLLYPISLSVSLRNAPKTTSGRCLNEQGNWGLFSVLPVSVLFPQSKELRSERWHRVKERENTIKEMLIVSAFQLSCSTEPVNECMCHVNKSRGDTSQEEHILASECVCSSWLWLFSKPYGSCWVSACLSCSLWPDGPQHCSMAQLIPLQHTVGARVQNKTHKHLHSVLCPWL